MTSPRAAIAEAGTPLPMPLPMRHQIGSQLLPLHRPELPGAAVSGLHFVQGEQQSASTQPLLQPLQPSLRGKDEARGPQVGFDDQPARLPVLLARTASSM